MICPPEPSPVVPSVVVSVVVPYVVVSVVVPYVVVPAVVPEVVVPAVVPEVVVVGPPAWLGPGGSLLQPPVATMVISTLPKRVTGTKWR